MAAALFIDGAYVLKVWQALHRPDRIDYLKLRRELERSFLCEGEVIDEGYFFNADPDPPRSSQNAFHRWLQMPQPRGPGLRVRLYWLQRKELYWPVSMGGGKVVHPVSGQVFTQTQQKAVDVGLIFHLMRSFAQRKWNKLLLAAGDGDFHEPVQHLVEHENVHLVTIGTAETMSSRISVLAREHFGIDQNADLIARGDPEPNLPEDTA